MLNNRDAQVARVKTQDVMSFEYLVNDEFLIFAEQADPSAELIRNSLARLRAAIEEIESLKARELICLGRFYIAPGGKLLGAKSDWDDMCDFEKAIAHRLAQVAECRRMGVSPCDDPLPF